MMEEQGRGLITGALKKLLGWMFNTYKQGLYRLEDKIVHNKSESGQKTVKQLVRKGRDLKLSEVIKNQKHLKDICLECKKQGIAFAVKKEQNGECRLLYQRKDADLVETSISNVLSNVIEKENTEKRSLVELLNRNKELSNKEHNRNEPLVHREVGAR